MEKIVGRNKSINMEPSEMRKTPPGTEVTFSPHPYKGNPIETYGKGTFSAVKLKDTQMISHV